MAMSDDLEKVAPANSLTVRGDEPINPVAAYLARLPSPRSRVALKYALDKIARILQPGYPAANAMSTPWQQLRVEHVDAIVAALSHYAPATMNQYLAALRGLIKTMGRLGLLTNEVQTRLLDFKSRKNDKPLSGRALEVTELRKLFAACDESPAGLRDAALLVLAFNAGMRREEIANAQIGWLVADEIRVIGKGGKIREVPIEPGARRRLAAWLTVSSPPNADPALPIIRRTLRNGKPGGALTKTGIGEALRDIGERAGLAHFTPHDLRRTFVTELLARGVDVVTVARMAGHSDPVTTMLYDRRTKDTARAGAALLDLTEKEKTDE
jgi:integrase